MEERLDIVVYGASGYTGKRCIGEIHRLTKADGRSLTWGIAGRSAEKLTAILAEYQKDNDEDLSDIPIIIADVNDHDSLTKMTAQARIIINCCGPYRFFGEPVVKACVETGTHQVDVTGEPQYMETIQLKYHKAAQEKGVYIVSSCGFDSIPADLGVIFLQKHFQGTLNSVETYLQVNEDPPITAGPMFNYATWVSLVQGLAHAGELQGIRRKLNSTPLPKCTPKLQPRSLIHSSKVINAWGVPFMGADRSVIQRSQRYLYEERRLRPVQIQTYQGVNSVVGLMLLAVYGNMITFLVKYKCGQNLLLKHPKLFSGGVFTHGSPPDEKMNKMKFTLTFKGRGWDKNVSSTVGGVEARPDKTIVGRVEGYNPGYGATCTIVTLAAIVILMESDKLPRRGGVYSPGAAFANTSLIEQLQRNGLVFEIKSNL